MTQPRIALDLDGVCYEWERTARYMLRRRYIETGRSVPPGLREESPHWDHIEQVVQPEDWKWLWSDGVAQGLYRYGHCVTGAIEGVRALSEIADIHILTARPRAAYRDTLDWLAFMFDRSPISGLHFCRTKTDFEADLYVDDGDHNIRALIAARGRDRVIAFRRRWTSAHPCDSSSDWPSLVTLITRRLV